MSVNSDPFVKKPYPLDIMKVADELGIDRGRLLAYLFATKDREEDNNKNVS